ncbi:hypothetical protein BO94DRAFT_490499 [Aspergillus sclerotioniger CBS 115572]|uniref:Uncharacterized protein n=1 Tax=Aspergillus sclerotioniger CBS 115572 TaxID=1450535 RepID=A0A317WT22_9EURO|nr:hypothetical protein BO94DRAFT_490499 [Aspergillus sclerotioniger CBS 115572]PWY89506.1 hypothetical protein BO94DRAFT_490499 [Aspergillus sclerotioniger CBS 115572]
MKQAIEQAGSIFTGWISSCLSCLSSKGDNESFHHQQAMKQKGAEREMKICHTQPHLVPPMNLAGDDDLPSPGPPPRVSSLQSWVVEGKARASRASNRASISLKRRSTAPVRISAPSDFRRVSMFLTEPDGYCPLELSFTSPGNRLPDLPRFDSYGLDITRPPRALSSAELGRAPHPRSHRPSSSFQLLRKPVGSGSRRSSLGAQELLEKHTSTTSPLIPHFSTRSSAVTGLTASMISTTTPRPHFSGGYASQVRNELRRDTNETATSTVPRTPTKPNLQDRPLPSIPTEDFPSSGSTYHPPTTPSESRPPTTSSENHNRTPTRSGRVTQWLFQTNSKPIPFSPSPGKPSDKGPFRIRTRTLSGSTLASSITNLTGGQKITPSLASGMTVAPTMRASNADTRDFDLPLGSPFSPKQTFPSVTEEHTYPTIHEGEQQQEHEDFEDLRAQYYENYRQSAVGLAF